MQALRDSIINSSSMVNSKACEDIQGLHKDVELKKKNVLEAAKVIASDSKLPSIGETTWKSMWLAAKKYSEEEAYKGISYPNVDKSAICVLCHQELDEAAKKRMGNFESFIKGHIESELKKAEDIYSKRLNDLPKISDDNMLKMSIQASLLDEEKWLPVLKNYWSSIQSVKNKLLEKNNEKVQGFDLAKDALSELDQIIQQLEVEIVTHVKDAETFDIKKVQIEINDLKAKKWGAAHLEIMLEEINRLKALDKINNWLKMLNTRGVSSKAGEISSKVITEAYVERFNKELKALGAGKIGVELVKSGVARGRVKHKLQLKNLNTAFSKMHLKPLSDGEKRIISLAAFLADVTGKPYKAPFVFDDPISSLDQAYEERTAQRLIELSTERQVIVFTHRLSLLGLLSGDGVHSKHIKREHWGCGEHGEVPLFGNKPMNAVNKLKNDRLAKARKELSANGTEFYNPLAKSICSDFRILLERIIEWELLGGIVLRHQRSITTKDKIGNLTKISNEDCELLEGLMTEYSRYEHSQSDEAPVELPSPDEIEKSLNTIIEWQEEFKKRKLG